MATIALWQMGKEGVTDVVLPFAQGLVLQASLIVALGAQNLYVLEAGLKRRKHWQVATLCSICDAALIALGVFGAGQFFLTYPALQVAIGGAGFAFLLWYAVLKLREGTRAANVNATPSTPQDLSHPLAAALGFSLLNPHVYLDTVVLVGGFSTKFAQQDARIAFGAGAAAFSTIWFFGLAALASRMSVVLSSEAGRRGVALGSAAILTILGVVLGVEVLSWLRALV